MKRKVGSRLAPSVAIENMLYGEVRSLLAAMFKATDNGLKRERLGVVRKAVADTFRSESRRITRDFINRVVNYTMLAFKSATKGFDAQTADTLRSKRSVRRVEKCWADCEGMIQDLPQLFYRKLDDAVRMYNDGRATQTWFDNRYADLKRQTLTRARLIAANENNKATEALLVSRCTESGITMVRWCHTHLPEQKPRDYHLRRWDGHSGKRNGRPNGLNGFIFDISNPPVIDLKTGERGFPAQLINCKCFLVPVEE